MNEKKITLIGMPGSGKSTWGRLYAEKYNLEFYDLDILITKKTNVSIKDTINTYGESYFRELECDTLNHFLNTVTKPYLLATGGGTPCYFDNIEIINRHSISVFLDVPIPDIISRIKDKELQNRPLFQDKDISSEIISLHERRLPYYLQAKKRVLNPKLDDISEVF